MAKYFSLKIVKVLNFHTHNNKREMTFKNRFSYKITGKKALQLKIIFDEDNLSIDWSKKFGIA